MQFRGHRNRLYHPLMSLFHRVGLCAVLCSSATAIVLGQTSAAAPRVLTASDYARAERFMTYNTTPLVLHAGVRASWLSGDASDRFWYRTRTEKGSEVVLVDPVKATPLPKRSLA